MARGTALCRCQLFISFFSNPSSSHSDSHPTTSKFREFLWPLISRLVGPATASPSNSAEVLNLCLVMFQTLRGDQSGILNLQDLANDWLELLLGHTTTEVGWISGIASVGTLTDCAFLGPDET